MSRRWLVLPLLVALVAPVVADTPAPDRGPLLPSVRKQVAACLLFAAHPFMPLVPTRDLLDRPCDHPTPCQCPAPQAPIAEPGTVLHNLAKLTEANGWMTAGELQLASGDLAAALTSFEKAQAAAPGSPLAARAEGAVLRVFARIYRTPQGGTEEAEPKTKPKAAPCPCNNAPKTGTPVEPTGLDKVRVRSGSLNIRSEPLDGSEESDDLPQWFLPWLHEWDVPANDA